MTEPPYLAIAADLRSRIRAGLLRPGDRVPSTRQLTRESGVALATAAKALAVLRQEGLVRTVPRVGTVVTTPATPGSAIAAPTRRRRQADPALTRDRIVGAAVTLADTEGIAALSMRRLGVELGVPTMSLYRFVRSRDELLRTMTDAVLGEDPLPASPPPGWRAQLELSARLQWSLYRRHPWLAQTFGLVRPVLSRNALVHANWMLRAADGLGLDPNSQLQVHVTVFSYVQGLAGNLERQAEAEAETGISDDEWMASQRARCDAMLESGDFPVFARVTARADFDLDLDAVFEFGLRLLLDGLARSIAR
jgi:DNA-binding transcriptional regulator YhcF (GntR family)